MAKGFEDKWNFPNCVGAIDGKHIGLKCPYEGGSYFFNYKNSHSIVLLALVDANYSFLFVDVGCNGRVSDGGVWAKCSLNSHVQQGTAGLPQTQQLPNSLREAPHVFVADDAFPLMPYLMKPYPFKKQSRRQRVFSYKLSRARRTAENAFGIMVQRFAVLKKNIELEPSVVEVIVLAITALHNFLLSRNSKAYIPPGLADTVTAEGAVVEGSWRQEDQGALLPFDHGQVPAYSTNEGKRVREIFTDYFVAEGSIPWQYD